MGVAFEGTSATPPVGPLLTPLVAMAVAAAEDEEEEGADSAETGGRFLEESTTCCGVTIGT